MGLAQPGDVVYSYANGVLGAVGIVIARASPCPKPTEFGSVGDYWSNDYPKYVPRSQPSARPYRGSA